MFTIQYTDPDGKVETGPVYGLKSTAEMAAEWRSKKRNQKWIAVPITEDKTNGYI